MLKAIQDMLNQTTTPIRQGTQFNPIKLPRANLPVFDDFISIPIDILSDDEAKQVAFLNKIQKQVGAIKKKKGK